MRLHAQLGYSISVHQKTPVDHNEVRILECQTLVQYMAGTQLGFVDVRLRGQIICNMHFEREIKFVRL